MIQGVHYEVEIVSSENDDKKKKPHPVKPHPVKPQSKAIPIEDKEEEAVSGLLALQESQMKDQQIPAAGTDHPSTASKDGGQPLGSEDDGTRCRPGDLSAAAAVESASTHRSQHGQDGSQADLRPNPFPETTSTQGKNKNKNLPFNYYFSKNLIFILIYIYNKNKNKSASSKQK